MSLDGLLVILVRTGVLLGATLVLILLARRNPAFRIATGRAGLLGAALLALSAPWLRERPRPVVPVVLAAAPTFWVSPPRLPALPQTASVKEAAPPMRQAAVTEPIDLTRSLPWAWAAGSLLLAAHLLLGAVALAQAQRGCRPVEVVGADRLAEAAGFPLPRVFEGPLVGGPYVSGVVRPAVYLPQGWAETTEPEVVEAVLRHEFAHIANGDLRWGLFSRLLRIALWPQPLVWTLRKPLAAAEEEACDRRVLAGGVSPDRYAKGLMALREGRRKRAVPALAIGAVSSRSGFGRRIEAILAFRGTDVRLSRRATWTVRGGALGLALGATFVFAHPSASPAQAPEADEIQAPYVGRVRVLDPSGKPVLGGKAWIVVSGDGPKPYLLTPKVEDGVILLPGGKARQDSQGALAVRVPGYALAMVNLWPAPKPVAEVRLDPPVSLSGRLLLPDGTSAAGEKVTVPFLVRIHKDHSFTFLPSAELPDALLRTTTDANGGFRLDGLPPNTDVQVDVDDPRYAQIGMTDRARTGTSGTATPKPVTLRLAGRIEGRVTQNGQPVAGLGIGAQPNEKENVSYDPSAGGHAVTGTDGRYVLDRLVPTVYNVAADIPEELGRDVTARAHEAVRVAAGGTVSGLDFDLVPGTLVEGTVTLDGKPVTNGQVGVYGPAHPVSSAWVGMERTDAQGRYRLRVPAGRQRIYMMDGRYEVPERYVETVEGTTTRLDLHVSLRKPDPDIPGEIAESATPAAPVPPVEDAPTGSTASFGPGKPFYGPVRLANGVTVRLAFLQDGSKGNPIWSPDGGPARPGDRKRALDMAGFGTSGPEAKSRRLFLRVEMDGVHPGDAYAAVRVPHPSSWTLWQSYGDSHGGTMDLASFRANKALKVTDMRFGVAAGPYRPAISAVMGAAPLFASAKEGQGGLPRTMVDQATASVTVRFPASLESKDVRLAAYTKEGKRLELASWQNDTIVTNAGERTRTYGFTGGSAKDVARVGLVVREYRWATFRGIRLYPRTP